MGNYPLSNPLRSKYDYSPGAMRKRKEYLQNEVDRSLAITLDEFEMMVGARNKMAEAVLLCLGAGKGKTSLFRQFVAKHWTDGIVYCASTIEELERVAYDLACVIGKEKILTLHGKAQDNITAFEDDPTVLDAYPVVLITHKRLVMEAPSMFLGLSREIAGGNRKPSKRWLFIDEKPEFYERYSLDQQKLALFQAAMTEYPSQEEQRGLLEGSLPAPAKPVMKPSLVSHLIMRELHPLIGKAIRLNASDAQCNLAQSLYSIITGKKSITYKDILRASAKAETISSMMVDKQMVMQKEEAVFYLGIDKLRFDNIVLMDATGDLYQRGSKQYRLVKTDQTSNHLKIDRIEQFDVQMISRNIENHSKWEGDFEEWALNHFRSLTQVLAGRHAKILVITWRDLKGEKRSRDYTNPLMEKINVADGEFIERLKGYVDPELLGRFNFTHYMSGQTRATSAFADAEAIIFLGKFGIPNFAVDGYNTALGTCCTVEDFLIAEYQQAIYRTRARRGESPISLYFSNDISTGFIDSVLHHCDARHLDGSRTYATTPEKRLENLFNIHDRNRSFFNFIRPYAVKLLNGDTVEVELTDTILNGRQLNDFKKGIKNLKKLEILKNRKRLLSFRLKAS